MANEMAEQPTALGRVLERGEEIEASVRAVVPRDLAGTLLVARGSSDHAAAAGRYLLEIASRRPTALATPSLLLRYEAGVDFSGHLAIGLSQSGHTPEIVDYLERARAAGAATIAVTNDGASPLAAAADLAVDLGAGPELAVPATKTVTTELLALTLIARALGPVPVAAPQLGRLPGQVAELLADPEPAARLAGSLAAAPHLVTTARGLLHGAALETALKIEEVTGKLVVAYSAADFRHGPIAIASAGLPVIAFDAGSGRTSADVRGLVERLREQGCAVYTAAPEPGADLPWQAGVPEPLMPVLAVVRGQQLALALALALGLDPDSPAGLSKVTAT